MEKAERITAKRKELLEVFKGLSEQEMKVASGLIDQASFLSVTLEDLNQSISENGTTETYTNGEHQTGRKVSSEVKVYSSLLSKYNAIVMKLLKIIPDNKKTVIRRVTPEDKAVSHIEHRRTEATTKSEKQRSIDKAFLEALKAGKVTQDDYYDFVASEDDIYIDR